MDQLPSIMSVIVGIVSSPFFYLAGITDKLIPSIDKNAKSPEKCEEKLAVFERRFIEYCLVPLAKRIEWNREPIDKHDVERIREKYNQFIFQIETARGHTQEYESTRQHFFYCLLLIAFELVAIAAVIALNSANIINWEWVTIPIIFLIGTVAIGSYLKRSLTSIKMAYQDRIKSIQLTSDTAMAKE